MNVGHVERAAAVEIDSVLIARPAVLGQVGLGLLLPLRAHGGVGQAQEGTAAQ